MNPVNRKLNCLMIAMDYITAGSYNKAVMKVKDIMTPVVVSVKENATLKEANSFLVQHRVSGLPVVDDHNNVVGVITEGDLIRAILPTYLEITEEETLIQNAENIEKKALEALKMKVKDIMSKPAVTIDEDAPIMRAGAIMLVKQIKRMPVVKGDKLVGVVSRANITEQMYK